MKYLKLMVLLVVTAFTIGSANAQVSVKIGGGRYVHGGRHYAHRSAYYRHHHRYYRYW